MKRFRKEIIASALIAITFVLLLLLETQLPFFRKFLPVDENKLVIVFLNINLLLILLLLFLVTRTLAKVYIEKKRGIWGSGLKTKLIVTFLLISIMPSFTLFVLATGFFNMSMDKWFSQRIEDTMDSAMGFAQFYYEDMFQRYERTARSLSSSLSKQRLWENETALRSFAKKSKAAHHVGFISIATDAGDIVAEGAGPPGDVTAKLANKARKSTKEHPIREIVPLAESDLVLSGTRITDEGGQFRATLFIGDTVRVQGAERIREIASITKEFKGSRSFKKILKYGFIIPLFLITVMTIFFSVWVGMKMATEITVPIEKVKEGAAIIASGKFDFSLEDPGSDEIGTLVTAFNSMARELKVAKDEVEERRRYMEVILDNVATGIISTDTKGSILLINGSAKKILGVERATWIGTPLREILGDEFRSLLRTFLKGTRDTGGGSITKEMRLNLNRNVTYIRASLTTLKDDAGKPQGFIVVFDDISLIVRAEKLATWREVARKLTHEIKNPLTPIVLSAERIRRRLLPQSEGKVKEVLDETTSIIIRSADDIKGIVNELTKLSHISQAKSVEDINPVIEETVATYGNLYQDILIRFEKTELPNFSIDREALRRALVNLISNSVKAIDGKKGEIVVQTRFDRERGAGIIEVADTGRGIPDEDKEKVFDPYFTKDKEGTGLGLAIVHSIVLEHHGKIHVEDNLPRGARFVIELPIVES